ncbi:MAG: flippase [Melioribacteraceae bacterium]|nr:flippase [Melioribacteraceae bacterium]
MIEKSKKLLIENILSFSLLQFLNYFIPFITFPYIINLVGVEKFGLINFSSAFVGYFILFIDYGFNISAVRLISTNRDNKRTLNEIICSIYIIKIILFIVSTILFFILINYLSFIKNYKLLYIITYFTVIGNIFLPIWFYQGIEKSKIIVLISFIMKIFWLFTIFYFVRNSNDYLRIAYLNSFNSIIVGFTLFTMMFIKYSFKIFLPDLKLIKKIFNDSTIVFLSTCAISIYTISNTFILGLFTSNTVVGYFTVADKIRQAFQNLLYPLTQSMYPRASYLFANSFQNGKRFILKSFIYVGLFSFIISLLLYITSNDLVNILLGYSNQRTVIVLKIISFLPFIIYLSNLFGIQTMLNINMKKQFSYIISFAAIINLFTTILLVPIFQEIGTAISVLFTELFVTSSIIIFLRKKGFFSNEI